MRLDDEIRLRHIIEACEAVIRYVAGVQLQDLHEDDMRARAIIQAIGVIGEAAARLTGDLQARHTDVPWAEIIGMRNRLVHGYYDIDYVRLWDTATSDVPQLMARMAEILSETSS